MPTPFLRRQSLTAEAAAATLAERQAHAAAAQTELDTKRDAYNAALAAAGPTLDTPDIERAERELKRAIDRYERAQAAVHFAETEHAAAKAEAARRETDARWKEIERLFAARAQAAEKYVSLIPVLVAARDGFLRAAQLAHDALPHAVKTAPGSDMYGARVASADARAELQRLGLLPDPRRASMGIPRGKTLVEISADLCAMVQRERHKPEARQHD